MVDDVAAPEADADEPPPDAAGPAAVAAQPTRSMSPSSSATSLYFTTSMRSSSVPCRTTSLDPASISCPSSADATSSTTVGSSKSTSALPLLMPVTASLSSHACFTAPKPESMLRSSSRATERGSPDTNTSPGMGPTVVCSRYSFGRPMRMSDVCRSRVTNCVSWSRVIVSVATTSSSTSMKAYGRSLSRIRMATSTTMSAGGGGSAKPLASVMGGSARARSLRSKNSLTSASVVPAGRLPTYSRLASRATVVLSRGKYLSATFCGRYVVVVSAPPAALIILLLLSKLLLLVVVLSGLLC
eukprot:PhM_4_TR14758/c0_g2_i1/m.70289